MANCSFGLKHGLKENLTKLILNSKLNIAVSLSLLQSIIASFWLQFSCFTWIQLSSSKYSDINLFFINGLYILPFVMCSLTYKPSPNLTHSKPSEFYSTGKLVSSLLCNFLVHQIFFFIASIIISNQDFYIDVEDYRYHFFCLPKNF